MGRFIRFCVHLLIMSVIFVLLLLCIALTTMQTKWAKRKITDLAIIALEKNGVHAKIEGLEGQLPFSWKVDRIELNFPSDQGLTFDRVTLRLAFFPLLRGHVAINYLNADRAEYEFFQSAAPEHIESSSWEAYQRALQEKIRQLTPLVHLSVRRLKVDHVHTHNLTTDRHLDFSLQAQGKWKKNNSEFLLSCKIASLANKRNEATGVSVPSDLEFFIHGSKALKTISTALKAHIGAVENLPFAHLLLFEGEALAEMQINGPWQTWESLVWNTSSSSLPLQGKVRARLSNVNVPELPLAFKPKEKDASSFLQDLINRDWFVSSQFALSSKRTCLVEKLQLYSNLLQLHAKGELVPDLKQSKGIITYSIPRLSPFSPLFHAELDGRAVGKGFYHRGSLKTILSASDLKINHYPVETLKAHFQAKKAGSPWTGILKLHAEEGVLPFDGSFVFSWAPDQFLDLCDIALDAHETSLKGNLKIELSDRLLSGSLYANVRHLAQFSPFLPAANADGSFGAEMIFSHGDQFEGSQDLRINFLSRNIRFYNYLIDDMSVSAHLIDLYNTPQGRLEMLAEKIFTPQIYLNQVFLRTHSNDESWPFFLNVIGPAHEPCDLNATGTWKKENGSFFLQLDHADAEIAEQVIVLETPFSIDWEPSQLLISSSDWSIGEGFLSASASFAPDQSLAELEMEHFPLQIFSIIKPQFSLEGSITARGFLDATQDNIQGALNIVLEEADFLHYGKKKPWRAKGSCQAHLNHSMLQVHTDLHAIGDQFLDFSASIPLSYQLYPFKISIDDLHPMSGELVAEGRIQDIFDFVNIGTHRITGFASCRLFLSQTFARPSLQGEIEWQNGTYENYYTGTQLRDIQARAEALNREIHLVSMTARDEEKGEMEADGKMELKPEARYPYAIRSELNNLHLLRFDTIDCYLTGSLYLTGSTQSALAQGNLIVPYATIHIPDQLPYEVPQVPVTYINRPPFLDASQIAPLPVFPFHIDLELTADEDVHVEGKGLSSEWEGSVRLTGTNTTVAANGSLSLISGDYLFSGKVFKLSEGEIVFNDKPSPSAYLKLRGNLSLSDVEVTALLRGPLSSPQLTFQSNPHMATSSILARILFNKDISDISHPEALQLANTLMSLSGGAGPDVLEAIRKSIGVDRLTIVSSSAGSDQIAVQIGKYLTKGVLITLSQSATSSQVIVEVELDKGFIFQAETQEEEEGKFSLKWRKSY
ncbi:MAG: translocation/assembly module TamB [Verrucomicrobia bacterium]|nr:translocation/assembly module TamB [Verrucomicrobiota bacterium]